MKVTDPSLKTFDMTAKSSVLANVCQHHIARSRLSSQLQSGLLKNMLRFGRSPRSISFALSLTPRFEMFDCKIARNSWMRIDTREVPPRHVNAFYNFVRVHKTVKMSPAMPVS